MKDKVWQLFKETGNPAYYMLYKELAKDGRNNKSDSVESDGLQRK